MYVRPRGWMLWGRVCLNGAAARLREVLTTMGDARMTEDEVDELLQAAAFDKDGHFDYRAFARSLKHGAGTAEIGAAD